MWVYLSVCLERNQHCYLGKRGIVDGTVTCYMSNNWSVEIEFCICIFTQWAGRRCLWHGAVEQPVWQSAAGAAHWHYPEEPHLARPSSSLAAP